MSSLYTFYNETRGAWFAQICDQFGATIVRGPASSTETGAVSGLRQHVERSRKLYVERIAYHRAQMEGERAKLGAINDFLGEKNEI